MHGKNQMVRCNIAQSGAADSPKRPGGVMHLAGFVVLPGER